MFQLTKSIDALWAHASERNKIKFFNKRHRDQSLLVAVAHLRSHAAARRGSAAIQRLRHGKIMARARQAGSARVRPWSGVPAGYRAFKSFKSSVAATGSAYPRRRTPPEHTVSPSSPAARDAAKPAGKSKGQEDELAQLRKQLARVTSDLEKIASSIFDKEIPSIQEDLLELVLESCYTMILTVMEQPGVLV